MKRSTHESQFIAGNLALDFVNTVGNRLGDPREYLTNTTDLARWARLAGLPRVVARRSFTPNDLAHVRATREELYRLFRALALNELPSQRALAPLNARLRAGASSRHLRVESGRVTWEWKAPAQGPDGLLARILFSAAELLISERRADIRECEGDVCGWLFLDRSPAGHRRWCRMADCGNREKARRHFKQRAKARKRA